MEYISSVIENDEDRVGIFDKSGESMKKFSHEILLMVGYLFSYQIVLQGRTKEKKEERIGSNRILCLLFLQLLLTFP